MPPKGPLSLCAKGYVLEAFKARYDMNLSRVCRIVCRIVNSCDGKTEANQMPLQLLINRSVANRAQYIGTLRWNTSCRLPRAR